MILADLSNFCKVHEYGNDISKWFVINMDQLTDCHAILKQACCCEMTEEKMAARGGHFDLAQ
jgi:hypothetical protein